MQVWGGLPCQTHHPLKCHRSSQELGKETVLRLEAQPAQVQPQAAPELSSLLTGKRDQVSLSLRAASALGREWGEEGHIPLSLRLRLSHPEATLQCI